MIDGIRYFWIAGNQYHGNNKERIKNMLSFLRGLYRFRKQTRRAGKAGRRHRLVHLSAGYLPGAQHREKVRRDADLRGARPVAAQPDRTRRHEPEAPVYPR